MAEPSALEQYWLELINSERTSRGEQPLAWNGALDQAAEDHSQWMIATDTFSHTGANGSDPTERMTAAGYALDGSWAAGENIAWATTWGQSFTYPHLGSGIASFAPRAMSVSAERPRQMTVFPGGGSRVRAR